MTEIVEETYEVLKVTDIVGNGRGYVVRKIDSERLDSINIWTDLEEVRDYVTDANNRAMLTQFWPDPADPDVTALVNDPDFAPLEFKEEEVIADYEELGRLVEAGEVRLEYDETTGEHKINPEDAAKVPTVKDKVLVDQSQPIQRFHQACESVAWDRLEAARGSN